MPIPIRLAPGSSIREVLSQWAQHLDRGLQERFGNDMSVSRSEQNTEFVLFLGQGNKVRGEIFIGWNAARPNEISIRPQPARARSGGDSFAFMATGVVLSCAAWLAFIVWFWDIFWDIRGVRGKVFWTLMIVIGWVLSTFGLAFAGDWLFERMHRLLDKPRLRDSEQWVNAEVWPWMQGYLDELWQRARNDEALARRLACDFSGS